jgi:hypothetical protein
MLQYLHQFTCTVHEANIFFSIQINRNIVVYDWDEVRVLWFNTKANESRRFEDWNCCRLALVRERNRCTTGLDCSLR